MISIQVMIEVPSITCFSCREIFLPAPLSSLSVINAQAEITLVRTGGGEYPATQHDGTTIPEFRVKGFVSDLGMLLQADTQGWRMIRLYGQTLYVCPRCRASNPRQRPEWERRLTLSDETSEILTALQNHYCLVIEDFIQGQCFLHPLREIDDLSPDRKYEAGSRKVVDRIPAERAVDRGLRLLTPDEVRERLYLMDIGQTQERPEGWRRFYIL